MRVFNTKTLAVRGARGVLGIAAKDILGRTNLVAVYVVTEKSAVNDANKLKPQISMHCKHGALEIATRPEYIATRHPAASTSRVAGRCRCEPSDIFHGILLGNRSLSSSRASARE